MFSPRTRLSNLHILIAYFDAFLHIYLILPLILHNPLSLSHAIILVFFLNFSIIPYTVTQG